MSGELRVHIPLGSRTGPAEGVDYAFAVDDDGLTRVVPDMLGLLFIWAYSESPGHFKLPAGSVRVERNY